MDEGEFIIKGVESHINIECILKDNHSFQLDELLDIRTTLLNTKIPEEFLLKYKEFNKMVDFFSNQITNLLNIERFVSSLAKNGHFNYQVYNKKFKNDEFDLIIKEFNILKEIHENWEKSIEKIRNEYFFLNNYNMKEIVRIINLIGIYKDTIDDDVEIINSKFELINFFLIISSNFNEEKLNLLCKNWNSDFKNPEDLLNKFGELLDNFFKDEEIKVRKIEIDCENIIGININNHSRTKPK
jgi:hypothetical protein